MQLQLDDLLQKQMDRKAFLKHVAFGVIALTGASAFIKAANPQFKQSAAGYGASAYGGGTTRPTQQTASVNR